MTGRATPAAIARAACFLLAALSLSACAMPISTCERQVAILFTGESVGLTVDCRDSHLR